jgi:hypothetical protein
MTRKIEPYRCWFLINQHERDRPFTADEQQAADSFLAFLSDKDYGEKIRVFRFDIYVEPTVNLGHHSDDAYIGTAHLSAHIDYKTFIHADSLYRHKLLLNAALTLCRFLSSKVVLPKGFDAIGLTKDFTEFLKQHSLLLSDLESQKSIIKVFETTTFNFVITTTAEVKDKDIHYDLMKIQDYLNNNLSGMTFGKSVRQFDFGYEIHNSKGYMKPWTETAALRRYGTKYKNLLVVKQFDYQQLKDKSHFEQFEILKTQILEAINDTDKLTRKPKDFDKDSFLATMKAMLNDYQKQHCS